MIWFYATKDKTQAGPVDDAALDGMFRSGSITAETLVWKEGMANWAPYAQVRTPQANPSEGPNQAICAECGKTFAADQLISLAGRNICGACKPVALQKLQEGVVSFGQTADAEELWRTVKQRGYNFTIGSVISRSWRLVAGNFWPCFGVTLLCYLIILGASQIPFAALFVQAQIMAGLNWYFLKQFRGATATLNDGFAGFHRGYGQLLLYMFIMTAIIFGVIMAIAVPAAILIPLLSSASKAGGSSFLVIGIISAVGIPVLLGVSYLYTCWMFAPILILDKGLKATAAMKLSRRVVQMHFWKIVGLFLAFLLLFLLGFLALIVGVLVVLPVAFAAMSRLYADIFDETGDGKLT